MNNMDLYDNKDLPVGAEEYLGKKVRDKITGFSGTCTSYVQYITGCDQAVVQPSADKDNKYIEGRYFDINRIEIMSDEPVIEVDTSQHKGACEPPPVK